MSQANFPSNHQLIIDRFLAACQADARIVAAFLGGSYASGAADAHSDLDLYRSPRMKRIRNFWPNAQPLSSS